MDRQAQILVEHGPGGAPALFSGAREVVVAQAAAEVAPALARLDQARAAGAWVAGWIAYEAGLAFEPRLAPLMRGAGPLLVMGIFDAPGDAGPLLARAAEEGAATRMERPEPLVARAA